jgi:tight adherence protein B
MSWNTFGNRPLLTPVVFVLCTFVLPHMWLGKRIAKRQMEFTKHFANAVDVMVRGLKAGMGPQESIRLISTEIPDPVGSEFRTVVDQVAAGVPLPQALEKAYERLPTQELRFFATVIAVQEQNGGNLGEILSKISQVLRDRAQLKEKAKALSGEARMSAIIVGSLPFLVTLVLFFANREYISLLWTTTIGNYFLMGAVFMMGMGVFIMKKMGELDV